MAQAHEKELPYSAATFSGGKSVHFIVSLETPIDEITWREWATALIRVMGADASTKNPSRFTRLPGSIRKSETGLIEQALLNLRGRTPNNIVKSFIMDHLPAPKLDKNSFFNNFMDIEDVETLHPLTQSFIDGTHPCPHGRNNALYKSAANFRDYGMDYAEAEEKLLPPALALGLDQWEIRQTLKSAFRKK
jgi:hypothetical protein